VVELGEPVLVRMFYASEIERLRPRLIPRLAAAVGLRPGALVVGM
jgi:hypothetical protein